MTTLDTAPASVRNATRDELRAAFYRLGIIDVDKQYRKAESLGFDLAPVPGGSTLPSFLNLSESEAQRLLAALNGGE